MATLSHTRTAEQDPRTAEFYRVTDAKVGRAVQQVIDSSDPLFVLAFGSWARGELHQSSDLDLAVILEVPRQASLAGASPARVDVPMPVDILEMTREELSQLSLRLNSVYRDIVEDGVVLYRRPGARALYASQLPNKEDLLQVKFDEVNLMLKKSSSDEEALNLNGQSPQIAAFHGQQAIEKLLKAWLVALDIAPPKTHELQRLEEALVSVGNKFPVLPVEFNTFNDYAVKWRYAGIPHPEQIDLAAMRETVAHLRVYIQAQIAAALPGIVLFTRAADQATTSLAEASLR